MHELVKDLEARREKAKRMGGQVKIDIQHGRGHLTARERVDKLVDPGTFREFGMLNLSDWPGMEEKTPADGLVSGIGKVDGRLAVIEATDKTVCAGAEGLVYMRKARVMHDYAVKRGFPLFHLGEGGGLRMPDGMGSDGISERIMPVDLLLHGRQVPLITSIMGESFGWPTWYAVSADFNVQVKGTCMAVAGPRMLEIATSEKISNEELGGWKLHADVTGQVDVFAESDEHCLALMKEFFTYMPSHADEEPPFKATRDDPYRKMEAAVKIVPTQMNRAYDMKRLIKVLVDDGIFFELKEFYGKALVTVLARMNGRVVGILANQPMFNAGAAGYQECDKAVEFICLCDSYHIPMVFLHDVPGFLVGSDAEKNKIPTKIMVWNQAVAWSTVPKISVVIRKSIGAAYGNMCGPTLGADFIAAWPTAQISFTGDDVGVNVVYKRQLEEAENPGEERKRLMARWAHQSSPYKAAAKHLIDDVIDPQDTRRFLCQVLEYACAKNGSKGRRLLANWPTGF